MANRLLTSFAVVVAFLLLAGCGEEKSPPVDPASVGARGAVKSAGMQAQMAKGPPGKPTAGMK